jgi:molybdenum cofactor synthesis domain-containing protein
MPKPQAIVITLSDSAAQGKRLDLSGPAAKEELEIMGCEVQATCILPDEVDHLKRHLLEYCLLDEIDLIITTGGTGLAPRDITPEATAAVLEKQIPGIAELIRLEGMKKTPRAALSRGIAGIRNRKLIINLPGSVAGVRDSLRALAPILLHALEIASGDSSPCGG